MTTTTRPRSAVVRDSWFHRHRVLTLLVANFAFLTSIFVVLEAAYRGQWIDFHRADLAASNQPETLEPGARTTILALGDSFTAGLDNWPTDLQDLLGPDTRVINSGVGGTTIRQMRIIAEERIRRFSPRLVICQIYTGNDLVDLRHPASGGRTGWFRTLYWRMTDRGWLVPWYLNTRLRQTLDRRLRNRMSDPIEMERIIAEMEVRPFSPEDYSPRSAVLLAASPTLIADQIAVTGEMEKAWSIYADELDGLAERCRSQEIPLLLVVVPHCTQVHPRYADQFRTLGATFPDPAVLTMNESIFVTRLKAVAARSPGVEVFDTLPSLRKQEGEGVELYFANDPHLNKTGRRVLADSIATALESR